MQNFKSFEKLVPGFFFIYLIFIESLVIAMDLGKNDYSLAVYILIFVSTIFKNSWPDLIKRKMLFYVSGSLLAFKILFPSIMLFLLALCFVVSLNSLQKQEKSENQNG